MGIYYEWSDYQKGLSYERLCQVMFDKGMVIKEEITDLKVMMPIVYEIKNIKEWSKENLDGLWTSIFQPNTSKEVLTLFFEKEEDITAFKLRWL